MKKSISKYQSAIKVALRYLILGILWIYFSDRVINQIAQDPDQIIYFQTFKGIFFVILSVILIYFLVNNELKKIRAINAELVEQEMMYRLLAENTSNLVVLHNIDGTPEYISPNIKKILGYSFEEYKGLEPFSRIYPEDIPIVKQHISDIIQGKEDIIFPFRFIKKGHCNLGGNQL